MIGSRQRDEDITTDDCYGNVSLPPGSIEWSGEVASSAIDMIRRSRSDASLFFKSAAIGSGVQGRLSVGDTMYGERKVVRVCGAGQRRPGAQPRQRIDRR